MELREPPRASSQGRSDTLARLLAGVAIVGLLAIGALVALDRGGSDPAVSARAREVGAKLQAAGALEAAAARYERALETADIDAETYAGIAYSLGSNYLERGEYEQALRWFYEAELVGAGELSAELGRKIVHTLERLGRYHSAQSALESRVQLEDDPAGEVRRAAGDPVVARIGSEEIHRSDVERALDELPAELAQAIRTEADRKEFVRQYVADELLWRKAQKLEYDQDPEVRRQHTSALKRLAVARLIEDEVVGKIAVDEADLKNFFEANKERYRSPGGDGAVAAEPEFEQIRPLVERDYRLTKLQSGYQSLIETELAAEEVEVFPEAMGEGG